MTAIFSGIRTFFGLPANRDTEYAVLGVPYDKGVTYHPGQRMAPAAIRDASFMLRDGFHPKWKTSPVDLDISDAGDVPIHVEETHAESMARIENMADRIQHPIVMGGDHSVTLPILHSLSHRHKTKLGLVHFDAHPDTWSGSHHGSFLREAIDDGAVDPARVVQIGIRSPITKDALDFATSRNIQFITPDEIGTDFRRNMNAVNDMLGDLPVYLTFDVDCLDPAFAPGTGTPEPAGLTSREVIAVMDALRHKRYVGMDVVEVLPMADTRIGATAHLAATVMWTYLCHRAYQKNNGMSFGEPGL